MPYCELQCATTREGFECSKNRFESAPETTLYGDTVVFGWPLIDENDSRIDVIRRALPMTGEPFAFLLFNGNWILEDGSRKELLDAYPEAIDEGGQRLVKVWACETPTRFAR